MVWCFGTEIPLPVPFIVFIAGFCCPRSHRLLSFFKCKKLNITCPSFLRSPSYLLLMLLPILMSCLMNSLHFRIADCVDLCYEIVAMSILLYQYIMSKINLISVFLVTNMHNIVIVIIMPMKFVCLFINFF
jgi:hypothetical protein